MLHKATEAEKAFIFSKAYHSAQEATKLKGPLDINRVQGMLQAILQSGGNYLVYRNNEGAMVGWILAGEHTDYLTGKRVGFMYEIYVLPEFRRQGFGKIITQECIRALKKKGYDEVRVNVFHGNFSLDLCNSLGFKELQRTMYLKI